MDLKKYVLYCQYISPSHFLNSPRNVNYDISATTGAFSNQNLEFGSLHKTRNNGGRAALVMEKKGR